MTVEQDDDLDEGDQVWHFVLTGQNEPGDARMDAEFDDGTTVTDLAPESTPGQTAHFFVSTSEGASLSSATAFFDSEQAGQNPQFVVSDCRVGNEDENGDDNGDDNGDEPADEMTPVPMPTDVPAGITSVSGGAGRSSVSLFGAAVVLAAAVGTLLRRRLGHGV